MLFDSDIYIIRAMNSRQNVNLLEGKEGKVIITFSLFFILSDLLQQLYNAVDTVILGRFVSTNALAAIGVATPIMNLFLYMIAGFAIGSSIVFARHFGKGDRDALRRSLSTALIIGLIFTVVLSTIGILVCKPFLKFLRTPDEILNDTFIYLCIIFAGNIFSFLYNFYCYAIRSIGNSLTPLVFLIIAVVINAGLDLVLVVGFNLGVMGAALATVIAQILSVIMVIYFTNTKIEILHLKFKDLIFDKTMVKDVLSYSSTVALQQSFVYIARICVQGLVNTYGADTIAGANVGEKINALMLIIFRGYTNAVTTFYSQNLGAGKYDRIANGYKSTYIVTAINTVVFTAIGVFLAKPLVSIFIDNASTSAIEAGVMYTKVQAYGYLFAFLIFQNQALFRGVGWLKSFFIQTFSTISLRVIFAYTLNGVLGRDSVFWAVPLSWVFGGTLSLCLGLYIYFNDILKHKKEIEKTL